MGHLSYTNARPGKHAHGRIALLGQALSVLHN